MSIKLLSTALLCASALSTLGSIGAQAGSVGHTGCIDRLNSTICSNGASLTLLDYAAENSVYIAGDFLLSLDRFSAIDAIYLDRVDGHSFVELKNGSLAAGGVAFGGGDAAISVTDNTGNGATVTLLDTSSVVGTDYGIQVTSVNFPAIPTPVRINTAAGGVSGAISDGINVFSFISDVFVDVHGPVSGAKAGINVTNLTGGVSVTSGSGLVEGGSNEGIHAESGNGVVAVIANGEVKSTGADAINAASQFGEVSVTTGAGSAVTSLGGNGITALAQDTADHQSEANVSVITGGSIEAVGDGIFAKTDFGAGLIDADGPITSTAGAGVYAETGGNLDVKTSGIILSKDAGVYAISHAGNTTITAKSNITASADAGIVAESFDGNVTVTTESNAKVIGQDGDGIYASISELGNGSGDISVYANGVTEGSYSGIGAFALAGNIIVETTNSVTGHGNDGIDAETDGGSITVSTAAGKLISGEYNNGIYAVSGSKGKDVIVNALGDTVGSLNGIVAIADNGNVVVTTGSGTTNGQSAGGILAKSFISSTVSNNGIAKGVDFGAGLASLQGNTLNNNGTIENRSLSESDLAILAGDSNTIINNNASGKIIGRIESNLVELASSETFNDSLVNAGLWQTSGMSKFGLGTDSVENSGTVRFASRAGASEATSFADLENFNNAGLLTSQDQAIGDNQFDTLELSGNFVGGAGSVLGLDAFLGGPGSLADVITIDGNSSGSTAINIRSTNGGDGALNTSGILLVKVKGTASASDFRLANGPINQGLFIYDLNYVAAAGDNQFLLISRPGTGANETVVAVDGLQNIWQGGADAWSSHLGNLRDWQTGGVKITAVADPAIPEDSQNRNLWFAGRGDWTQLSTQSSFTYLNNTNTFNVGYDQSTYGFDGGVDFGGDVGNGGRLLFGLVGGYASSRLNFESSANSIDLQGGSIGTYASFTNGGLFADLLVKQDWLGLEYNIPGSGQATTNGRTLGASANIGYRFGTEKMFMEPLVSVSSTKTSIDQFTVGGGTVVPGTNTSTRVGAGARIGVQEVAYSASLTARIWNGIGDGNSVQVLGGGAPTTVNDPGFAHGLSGEVSGNLNALLSSNAQLFAGGALHFNKDAMNESINAGLSFSW